MCVVCVRERERVRVCVREREKAKSLRMCVWSLSSSTCDLYEKSFNSKLYGNEVYCTNASLLLIKIMLCSKLHCQKVFRLKLFSYKIRETSSRVNSEHFEVRGHNLAWGPGANLETSFTLYTSHSKAWGFRMSGLGVRVTDFRLRVESF